MSVAAAIFAANAASALADVGRVPAARHIALIAREAGVGTVLVVAFDPEGAVAAAIEGVATLVEPAPPEQGPVAQLARGIDAALATDPSRSGVLLWPARVTDVTGETVGALIAAHETDPVSIVRPGADDASGFPALFPVRHRDAFRGIGPDRMPGDVLREVVDAGIPLHVLAAREAGRA